MQVWMKVLMNAWSASYHMGKFMVLTIHTSRSFEEMCHGIAPPTTPSWQLWPNLHVTKIAMILFSRLSGINLSQIGRSGPTYNITYAPELMDRNRHRLCTWKFLVTTKPLIGFGIIIGGWWTRSYRFGMFESPVVLLTHGLAVPRKFLGIVGQDPSDSKPNRLHVDIFRFCFHSYEVYSSIDSSTMIVNSLKLSNFNGLFLKLNRFICNQPPVLPEQWCWTRTGEGQDLLGSSQPGMGLTGPCWRCHAGGRNGWLCGRDGHCSSTVFLSSCTSKDSNWGLSNILTPTSLSSGIAPILRQHLL